MLLICDSGSTKADWCLVDKNNKRVFLTTCGMNPYNISSEAISQEIESNIVPAINTKDVSELRFYGAGCSADIKKNELKVLFERYFPNASIEIDHDLLGAARALCGKEKGLCAILGTGSNSCIYDGEDVLENIPSLGYVLCDEGAGTNIGKIILRNYLRGLLPKDLKDEFAKLYPGEEADFLNKLYKGARPNYFLASFAKFVSDRKDNIYCRNIIKESFISFFENQVLLYSNYSNYKINVVGSIGFICKDIFEEVALSYGQEVGKFIKAPLVDLVDFHFYLD